MKMICSVLLLLLYLAATGRPSDAQLLQQSDDVDTPYDKSDNSEMQLIPGTDTIYITWSVYANVIHTNISYHPADGDFKKINDTCTELINLVPCTTYTINLVLSDSGYTVILNVTDSSTTLIADPDPVGSVTVDPLSTQLYVSWPKAQGAGNCVITYRITWTPASGEGSRQNTTSDLSYTITGLTACTTYIVCVAAKTDGGYYTEAVCPRQTTDEETPGPVVSLSVETLSNTSLAVSWGPPESQNCIIINYNIMWSGVSYNTLNTSYTITGLAACTSYTVTVTAATGKGLGTPTSESNTTDSIAPDSPEVTAAMVVDESDKLSVSWTQPDDPGPMCPVTRYNVTWYHAGTQELVGQMTTSGTSFAISDLEAWTNYTICVAVATQQDLVERYSEPSCTDAETDQDTPGPPSGTKIAFQTARSLLVMWSPPEEPRGIITSYSVAWSPPDTGNGTEVTVDATVTQYNIRSLEACVTYTVTVTAATCKGYGERQDDEWINGTTDPEPPPASSATCEEVIFPRQVTVTWLKVDTKCPVSGYKVNYTGDVLWSDDTRHGSQELQTTYADLSDLTPWTTYNVCVAGVVVNNIVGAWNCCSSTTLEAAPGPPAELTVASVSSKTVTVSWAPPEALNGVLTDYQVVWDKGYTNLTSNVTTYTVSNRQPKSQFTVTVKAGTTAGWGPPAVVCGTTDDDVNVGAVVGGVVGGLLLLALLVAAVFFRHKIMDTFQAAKHSRPLHPVTIAHPGDQVKKDVMTHDPAHINALHSGSHVPRALREEVLQHKAPCVQSPGGLAMNTVNTHPHSNHIYENEIFDEDDPIYISLD